MKYHRLTLLAAIVLSIVMFVLVIVYDQVHHLYRHTKYFEWGILLSFMILGICNYIILQLLFSSYGKRQIKKISKILPPETASAQEDDLTLEDIESRINKLNQQKEVELDMMKQMESYRKEYIGNVSHELKTPLFSIQGYIETLKDGAIDDLKIRDKYVERVGKQVDRLIDIVSDLDMINRYEVGEISLTKSTFDINELVREIFELLDLDAQEKGVTLALKTMQPQVLVLADKQKISQVFINLISNAIYYANRAEARVTVKTTILKSKVLVEVRDNGMGIKPEVLPRVFERFYRVESSRNRREGGSGLGLAIVKHILEAHQETIQVESAYLEGASFIFMLPSAHV